MVSTLGPIRIALVALGLASGASAAAAVLPGPPEVPEGPAGVGAPGGQGLPSMTGPAPATAPAISAIGDVTFPDETLVMTGHGLEGARIRVWAEGKIADVEPLRTAHNRMQAVVPRDFPVSAMLVWPTKGDVAGSPIRVNGATVWWAWPARAIAGRPGQTVRLFGRNLRLEGHDARAYLAGPGVAAWLTVRDATLVQIEAELPESLDEGTYRVWAHNGTGGRYGWSEPASLEVKRVPPAAGLPTFDVGAFGARADDDRDDAPAIQDAVRAAERAGGGIVRFGAGTYHVAVPIRVGAAERGIHLVGAGMGEHAPRDHSLRGTFTALIRPARGAAPPFLVSLDGAASSVRQMTLLNAHDGADQVTLAIRAPDVVVERTRAILVDERGAGPRQSRGRIIDTGALYVNSAGKANVVLSDAEVHAPGPGIVIGDVQPAHDDEAPPAASTDFVQIRNVKFRGYYAGEPSGGVVPRATGLSAGVVVLNAKHLIVERSDFAGADKEHGRSLGRTVFVFNTSARNLYLANNRSVGVGPHPASRMHTNQGEQYLFHLRYPQGGLFDVIEAEARTVTIETRNIKPFATSGYSSRLTSWGAAGSRALDEVGRNDHWIVFVCAGKGVGQYRVVDGMTRRPEGVVLHVRESWRVVPDGQSRLVLLVAFRQNILHGNEVDGGHLVTSHKSLGILFLYAAFDNIMTGNTFRNLTSGLLISTGFRNPTGWNVARGNQFENIHGYSGGSSPKAAFYAHHFRLDGSRWPGPSDRVWYSVGNVARSSRGRDGDVAAFLIARMSAGQRVENMPHPDGGLVMDVIENSRFEAVADGIVLGPPATDFVLRSNEVARRAGGSQ